MSETVVGEGGMVVAPHRAAAEAGAEILREGGNALEAMIAAAATIAVVYPHMNSIGGDCFATFAEPGRAPHSLDASGRAGSLATRQRYEAKGHDVIPSRGPDAALTVAGAVSGWELLYDVSRAMGGRLSRRDLLADAVKRAREGIAVTASQSRMSADNLATLGDVPGFSQHFLPAGKAPERGANLVPGKLADTLEYLAQAGFRDFYRGDIAAEIAYDLEAASTPVTRDDLARHEARLVEPLTVRIEGARLYNTPPPTQGLASLIILGLFDRLGIKRGESFDHIHGLIESTKRAFRVRDAEVTDPLHADDVRRFLDPAWLAADAERIDMRHAAPWPTDGKGDTVWLGAIDAEGRAISFIQSIYWEFGSGVVLPRTGILWQNRGVSFSLDPQNRNPLSPGRKPFHTLNPPLARFDDGRLMVYGSMGGDAQPQFQSQIFTRAECFAMELGDAIAAPRWRLGRTWGEGRGGVEMENRFDPDVIAALERAGHEIRILPAAFSDDMGHAGAIVRAINGRLTGASDPRSDGAAVGI